MGYVKWICPKCQSEDHKVRELMMIGKEILKAGHFFNVFTCTKCGYSEFFYKSQETVIF